MTTEEYLQARLKDNDLAEPFLLCMKSERNLRALHAASDKLVEALRKITLCARCGGDGYWLYWNSDGSGSDRYDCGCLEVRKALAEYDQISALQKVEA